MGNLRRVGRAVLAGVLLTGVAWPLVGGQAAAGTGPILVVAAHPDDEALGFAGIIDSARSAGRRVYVAVVTNGDSAPTSSTGGVCGTSGSNESNAAQTGLRRGGETLDAMAVLGLSWSPNTAASDIFFLGYPDGVLNTVAGAGTPFTNDSTGLHRTYARDGDTNTATCNGDFRYGLSARHSQLTATDLAADFDALLALTNPSDIYTHSPIDGHADHAEVYRQVKGAAQRKGVDVTLHATLIHEEGSGACMALSAQRWPNPALANNDPYARFTPHLDVTAPPTPTCAPTPTGSSWGSLGPPNELVPVPASMTSSNEATNKKWQVISKYTSQLDCNEGTGTPGVSCGYLRAFVKAREFFWSESITAPPAPPPGTGAFGASTPGTITDRPAPGWKFGSISTLTEHATTTAFRFYARGGSVAQRFVPAVYRVDALNNPTDLVATGAETTVAAGQAAGWVSSTLPSVTLAPGRYQLAILSGPTGGGAYLYYASEAGASLYNANTYPSPSATWGALNTSGARWSFGVNYTALPPPAADTQAPVASVTAPTAGSTVSGIVTATASATDNVGVARVETYVDTVLHSTDTTAPYSASWDTTLVANGSHSLVAKAFDAAGNMGTSAPVSVTVTNNVRTMGATTPGSLTDQPAAGYKFGTVFALADYGTTANFRFYARGGAAAQKFVTAVYAVDAADRPTTRLAVGAEVTVAAGQAAGWVSSALPAVSLTPGRYQLAVLSGPASGGAVLYYAASGANAGSWSGNAYPTPSSPWGTYNASTAMWSFNLVYQYVEPPVTDTQAPATSVTSPAGGSSVSGSATISATASDNVGVTRVEVFVDAVLFKTLTAAPYTTSWDTAEVDNGTHTLSAKAYDAAGNVGTSANVTVTVANDISLFGETTPGTLTDQPAQGYKFGSVFPLAENATASSIRFYARGGTAAQNFVPVVYAVNSSGQPTTLMAQGAEVIVAAGRAPGWVSSTLPAVTLPPGRYQLGVLGGPQSGGAHLYYASQSNGGFYNSNAYPAPTATWGALNPMNARWSIAVKYVATPLPPDTQAPTAAVTNPASGSTLSDTVNVTASATDNVWVARVEISIDGTLRSTLTEAPYTFAWDTTTAANGPHTIVARSYDAAGNVGTSSTVSVTVSNVVLVSDDFSGAGLDPSRWTFVNPLADGATASVNGTQALISVPAGQSHYVWTDGAKAPRIMQAVSNRDFEVEAKFQSNLSVQNQIQGIIIEQDANNFVRFDVAEAFCQLQIAGSTVAGTGGTGWFVRDIRGGSDIYLRVRRQGNDWTLSYSYDGQAWTTSGTFTKALNVTRVGPFAGNSASTGSAPAFTAKVDYFVNRSLPPTTEDGAQFGSAPAAPAIDVWYGDNQTFGQHGRPQQWVNVVGKVKDPDGLSALTYSVNGGPEQLLSQGEDTTRLVSPGDFNVELAFTSLNAGANTVRVRAVDRTGSIALRTVTVNIANVAVPDNYSINWSTAGSINNVAQVSDGKWALQPDGTVRTVETGYDRLIELGDMSSWQDYEVSAEVTIWDMPCGGGAVGLVAGWTGHTTDQYGVPLTNQPRIGHPFPAFGSYINSPGEVPRLSIGANTTRYQETALVSDTSGRQLTLGVPYVFKLRTTTNAGGGSTFKLKVWQVGTTEPAAWDLQFTDGDASVGSVVLAAHKSDASFGNVTVTGL